MKRPVIYFSLVEWSFLWSRPQQLMSRIAQHREVLYVEVHGARNLVKDFHFPGDLVRISKKLKNWVNKSKEHTDGQTAVAGITVTAPMMFPVSGSSTLNSLSQKLLWRSMQAKCEPFRTRDAHLILTIPRPDLLAIIDRFPNSRLIYDCMDDYSDFPASHPLLNQWERQLAGRADLITTSSQALQHKFVALARRVERIPNGVEFEHFHAAATGSLPEPADIQRIPKPRVLYFGVMNEWFDVSLMQEVVAANAKCSFVFIGIDVIGLEDRLRSPNCYFLQRKDYSELPAYLAHCQVCTIPFKITPLTIATNPIKLYEYLAGGLPVVSTPLPEVKKHSDVVAIAPHSQAFSQAINSFLSTSDDRLREQRIRCAKENSWDARSQRLEQLLKEYDD